MEIDWSVGEILKALKKHRLDKDTLVIFTSDNGPWLSYGDHAGSAGPLREGKGTTWEGGTRVPCLMRWPGKIPAGPTCDAMLMIGDESPRQKIDGLDVWPLISGAKNATNPHAAYFFWYGPNELQAVTSGDGRWKLLLPHQYRTLGGSPGGTNGIPAKYDQARIVSTELYDLKNDPGEQRNLAAAHPEIVRHLTDLARKAREDLGDSLTGHKGNGAREPGRL